MAIYQKALSGVCEITTGTFTPTTTMPVFTGEKNGTILTVAFKNAGADYTIPADVEVRAYLYYDAKEIMTTSALMTSSGNSASCAIPDSFTAVAGSPQVIVRMVGSDGKIIVACAFTVTVKAAVSANAIYLSPPSPDTIVYIGRSPYIGTNSHWYVFSNTTFTFEDSGVLATGNPGATGATGAAGTPAYVHIKWGTSLTPATLLNTPNEYIGIASTASATAPATYSGYSWYKYKGDKGDTGEQGVGYTIKGVAYATVTALRAAVTTPAIGDQYNVGAAAPYNVYRYTGLAAPDDWEDQGQLQGPAGAAGASAYVHIRWGTSATPSTLLTSPNDYIGVASTASATAPDIYTGYSWYKYKGETGATGANGQGVPTGGAAGQLLKKVDGTDFNATWVSLMPEEIGALPYGAVSSNLLINGGFDIWQRGTSQTAGGYASDDRWANQHNASTKSHSRQEFTVGQTDVPNNPKYYSRTVVASAGTSGAYVFKMQSIEDVTRLGGKIVTLSLWAKADASKNISLEMLQNFGSGGSTDVQGIGVAKLALTTSWQMLTVTFALPSISGKTVGANSHTGLRIWFESGSDLAGLSGSLGNQSGTFDIANVQLNYGSVALPFVPRSFTDELRLCQRYFEKSYSYSDAPGTATGNALFFTTVLSTAVLNGYRWMLAAQPRFNTIKRVAPTITVYDATGASGSIQVPSGTIRATGTSEVSTNGFAFTNNTGGTVTPSAGEAYGHWTADAEL